MNVAQQAACAAASASVASSEVTSRITCGDRPVIGPGDLGAHARGDVGVLARHLEDVADPVRGDATVVDEQVVGEFGVVADAVFERTALTVVGDRTVEELIGDDPIDAERRRREGGVAHAFPDHVHRVIQRVGELVGVISRSQRVELGADHEDRPVDVDRSDRLDGVFVAGQGVAEVRPVDLRREVGAVDDQVGDLERRSRRRFGILVRRWQARIVGREGGERGCVAVTRIAERCGQQRPVAGIRERVLDDAIERLVVDRGRLAVEVVGR